MWHQERLMDGSHPKVWSERSHCQASVESEHLISIAMNKSSNCRFALHMGTFADERV